MKLKYFKIKDVFLPQDSIRSKRNELMKIIHPDKNQDVNSGDTALLNKEYEGILFMSEYWSDEICCLMQSAPVKRGFLGNLDGDKIMQTAEKVIDGIGKVPDMLDKGNQMLTNIKDAASIFQGIMQPQSAKRTPTKRKTKNVRVK